MSNSHKVLLSLINILNGAHHSRNGIPKSWEPIFQRLWVIGRMGWTETIKLQPILEGVQDYKDHFADCLIEVGNYVRSPKPHDNDEEEEEDIEQDSAKKKTELAKKKFTPKSREQEGTEKGSELTEGGATAKTCHGGVDDAKDSENHFNDDGEM